MVAGSALGAGGGIDSGNDGTRSALTRVRIALDIPRTPGTRSPVRAARSTEAQRRASPSATFSSRSVRSRALNSLIIAPVSIASGHEGAHVPSAAQVWIPSYSYSASSASYTGEPSGCRAISRRSTIRCRGVVVTLRLGHTGSQKPHSTQCAATSSITGWILKLLR